MMLIGMKCEGDSEEGWVHKSTRRFDLLIDSGSDDGGHFTFNPRTSSLHATVGRGTVHIPVDTGLGGLTEWETVNAYGGLERKAELRHFQAAGGYRAAGLQERPAFDAFAWMRERDEKNEKAEMKRLADSLHAERRSRPVPEVFKPKFAAYTEPTYGMGRYPTRPSGSLNAADLADFVPPKPAPILPFTGATQDDPIVNYWRGWCARKDAENAALSFNVTLTEQDVIASDMPRVGKRPDVGLSADTVSALMLSGMLGGRTGGSLRSYSPGELMAARGMDCYLR